MFFAKYPKLGLGKTDSFASNYQNFIEYLKAFTIDHQDLLVVFSLQIFYTNIPITYLAIEEIQALNILQLIERYLILTYSPVQGKQY